MILNRGNLCVAGIKQSVVCGRSDRWSMCFHSECFCKLYLLYTPNNSLHSDDYIRPGCQNISHYHHHTQLDDHTLLAFDNYNSCIQTIHWYTLWQTTEEALL